MRWRLLLWSLTLPVAGTIPAAAIRAETSAFCGTFPDDMPEYGGWSGCALKRIGEPPLWHGLHSGSRQVLRFTFTQGHGMFFRVVTITQAVDGSAVMAVRGTLPRQSIRQPERTMLRRTAHLNRAAMERIDRLVAASGTFDFERGSWDGNGESVYIHCQTLDMERVDASGYRVSVVSIGCNQPKKLMPLVEEVVRLAKMKNTEDGMLFY